MSDLKYSLDDGAVLEFRDIEWSKTGRCYAQVVASAPDGAILANSKCEMSDARSRLYVAQEIAAHNGAKPDVWTDALLAAFSALDEQHRGGGEAADLPFFTAAEIAMRTTTELQWVVRLFMALGSIVELDAKVKSGKTTFVLAMCRKILDGLPFLGQLTMKTPIVFLTEQPYSSFSQALKKADLVNREDFVVLFFHDTIGTSWPQVVEAAARKMEEIGAKFLVVDTLPQFARLRGDAENNAGQALEAIEPLQQIAGQDNAVWLNRHERKGGGEIGESARGSSAFSGVVDTILTLRRGEGATSPTIRVIQSLSRFDATPGELTIDYRDGEYRSLGTTKQVVLEAARTSVAEALPETEEAAKTLDAMVEASGQKRTMTQQVLREYVAQDIAATTGTGHKGDAKRYYRGNSFRQNPP